MESNKKTLFSVTETDQCIVSSKLWFSCALAAISVNLPAPIGGALWMAIHSLTRPYRKQSLNLGHVDFGFRQSRVVQSSKYPFETGYKSLAGKRSSGRVKKIVVAR